MSLCQPSPARIAALTSMTGPLSATQLLRQRSPAYGRGSDDNKAGHGPEAEAQHRQGPGSGLRTGAGHGKRPV